jgi:hypothetical protein
VDIDGADEVILWNCTAAGGVTGDNITYHSLNTVVPNAIEYKVTSYNCGDTTTDQASTMHDAGKILRIMGDYSYTRGQVIADVNDSLTWMLGCELHHPEPTSGNKRGYYADADAWLDSCYIHDVDNEHLYAEASGDNILYRSLLTDVTLVTGGSGTISTY